MTLCTGNIEDFLSSMSANGASDDTIRAYRADLTLFLEWAGPMPTMENCEAVAKQYLNVGRQDWWAPRTTNRKTAAFRSWARYMGFPGFLGEYRGPKPPRAQPHPLPKGITDLLNVLAEADGKPEYQCLIALCGLAGLRVSEARNVRKDDIDLRDMTLYVRGKGQKFRIVPLSKLAWDFIKAAYSAVKDMTARLLRMADRTARKWLKRFGEAVTNAEAASHDYRATYGTAAYRKTKNLRVVQELLGHASSTTTEVYTMVSMNEMRDAVEFVG